MGYCMSLTESTAHMERDNVPAAVAALKRLDRTGNKSGGEWGGGAQRASWFAWVNQGWANTDSIVEMLAAWRYDLIEYKDGNLLVESFFGEKYGDDDQLWETLSPYMTGYIQMRGEDGEQWRWVLGRKFETLQGHTTFS